MPEINAEELVQNIEKYGSADGAPKETPETVEAPSTEAAPTETPGFSFKTAEDLYKHKLKYAADGGKEVEEDIQTILRRAGQGYHFAQKMNQLNTERSEWEQKVKAAQEKEEKWGRFDEYAKQNPQWYQHWENAWQNRGQNLAEPGASEGNIDQRINALLEERLKPVNELLSHHEEQKLRERVQTEDRQLDEAVKSIRAKHPDIDFDATDPESGKSLEFKVLEFGAQNGIKDFGVAFRAFYHDELVKREREKAKDEFAKNRQAQTKAGIVDPKSATGNKPPPNFKTMSMEQLAQLAAKEMGLNN